MSLSFSEIESGFLLPYENEMPLSSKDPWQEAREWCQALKVTGSECLVVGLGGGFHIAELLRIKKLDKVFVVDTRPGLLNIFRRQFSDLNSKVEIIIIEDESALLRHDIMDEVIFHHLDAFAFTACWPRKSENFRTIHRHLTGRSQESLNLFFRQQGLEKQIELNVDSGQRYLSIKDLELVIQEDVPPFLRLNCFRILKELLV